MADGFRPGPRPPLLGQHVRRTDDPSPLPDVGKVCGVSTSGRVYVVWPRSGEYEDRAGLTVTDDCHCWEPCDDDD